MKEWFEWLDYRHWDYGQSKAPKQTSRTRTRRETSKTKKPVIKSQHQQRLKATKEKESKRNHLENHISCWHSTLACYWASVPLETLQKLPQLARVGTKRTLDTWQQSFSARILSRSEVNFVSSLVKKKWCQVEHVPICFFQDYQICISK